MFVIYCGTSSIKAATYIKTTKAMLAENGNLESTAVQSERLGDMHTVACGRTTHVLTSFTDVNEKEGGLLIAFTGWLENCHDDKPPNPGKALSNVSYTDAEKFAETYRADGLKGISRLQGKFAFCLRDHKLGKTIAGTDFLGRGSLYCRQGDSAVEFSSSLAALRDCHGGKPELNLLAVHDYLTFGVVLPTQTLLKGVTATPPGTVLVWDGKHLRSDKVWAPGQSKKAPAKRRPLLLRRLKKAASTCLKGIADYSYLSSPGLVSLALAAALPHEPQGVDERRNGDKNTDNPVETMLAEKLKADVNSDIFQSGIVSQIPAITASMEMPLAQLGGLVESGKIQSTYIVSDVGIKGIIDKNNLLHQFSKGSSCAAPGVGVVALWEEVLMRRDRYIRYLPYFQDHMKITSYDTSLAPYLFVSSSESLGSEFEQHNDQALIEQAQRFEFSTFLSSKLKTLDASAAQHNAKMIYPCLEINFVEWLFSLHPEYQLNSVQKTRPISNLLNSLIDKEYPNSNEFLSEDIRFSDDQLTNWLHGDVKAQVERVLKSRSFVQRHLLSTDSIDLLLSDRSPNMENHSRKIWLLVSLEIWCRLFIDRQSLASVKRSWSSKPNSRSSSVSKPVRRRVAA